MRRRPDRALLLLAPPLLLFVAFGAARVDAPVSLIGLLFDRPVDFALAATALVFGGAVLMFVPPIERRIAGVFAPSREPEPAERERLERLLGELGQRSRIKTGRLILRVQDSEQLNAAAGGGASALRQRGGAATARSGARGAARPRARASSWDASDRHRDGLVALAAR